MRVGAVLIATGLALTGCGTVTTTTVEMRPRVVRTPDPIDPLALAKKLIAIQPDWPTTRKIDCKRAKCVALTFDDGPGKYTGKLLDMLSKHRVRATFFLVGEMVEENGRHTLPRMVADGHELGNHTWSHAQLTALSTDGVRRELQRTQDLVERLTGVRMRVMRPPYGSTDGRVAAETRHEKLAQILWNVDTLDWRDRVRSIVAKRACDAKPGSIVLMHDIHSSTVDAVPHILDTLLDKGYTFVTISELYGSTPAPGRKYTER